MATIIKKFWPDGDNPKLIQLVKENVILWDVRNDEYINLARRSQCYGRKYQKISGQIAAITRYIIIVQYTSLSYINS